MKLLSTDNAKYLVSWISGGVVGYSLSIYANYSLLGLECSSGKAALGTALAKIFGFYLGNICFYYLLNLDKPVKMRLAAVRTLAASNVRGALTSFILRVIFHTLLLKVDLSPVASYLICYPLPSLAGTSVKFRHDAKHGLFKAGKSHSGTGDELSSSPLSAEAEELDAIYSEGSLR